MGKSSKELAYLRNLYVEPDWTRRFTDLFDANFKLTKEKKVLYVNAGTGNHAMALREKLNKDSEMRATSENAELLKIAQAKADAVKAQIDFLPELPSERFDAVLADASFVKPDKLEEFLARIVKLSNDQVILFLPTAGSFGDIFSFLWESLLNADLLEKGAEVERLITEIPTVSKVEEMAENLGLTKLQTETKNEFFEFESAEEFVNSPLVADFLFPAWLDFLDKKQQAKVIKQLAPLVDKERGDMSFRFSVKMSVMRGEKKD